MSEGINLDASNSDQEDGDEGGELEASSDVKSGLITQIMSGGCI